MTRDDVLAGVFDSVMPGPIATAAFVTHAPSESGMPRIPEMSHRSFVQALGYDPRYMATTQAYFSPTSAFIGDPRKW